MKSDFKIHRDFKLIREDMIEELKKEGATFFRMTFFDREQVLVLEGWKIQPEDQGPEPKIEDFIGFGT